MGPLGLLFDFGDDTHACLLGAAVALCGEDGTPSEAPLRVHELACPECRAIYAESVDSMWP